MLLHAELEQDRRDERGDDNDQNDRREHMRVDQTGLLALLRNDQRDLAARYHAQTDGERIIGLEAHQLCAEAAADAEEAPVDLGDGNDMPEDLLDE